MVNSLEIVDSSSIRSGKSIKDEDEEVMLEFRGLVLTRTMYYTLLLAAINFVLFADQNLLAPVLTRIAREYGFVMKDENGTALVEFDEVLGKDAEVVDEVKRDLFLGGYVTLAFFMIGGISSLLTGYLTDIWSRRNMLAVVVVAGELCCFLTFFLSQTYGQLLMMRSLTGIALGGASPLMFSMFGDLFSVASRGKAIAFAVIAMGAGSGFGQILMGVVAGEEGANWRYSFLIVSIPAFALVIVLLYTVPEPKRGMKEEVIRHEAVEKEDGDDVADYEERISFQKIKRLFKTPTVILVFSQGIPGSLGWGVILGFLADFMIQSKGITIPQSGTLVLSFGLGNVLGAMFGGWLADHYKERKQIIPLVMGTSTALGAVPMWLLLNLPMLPLWQYLLYLIPSGFVTGITGTSVKAVLVNVTLPELRGTAFSIFNLCDDIGRGAGAFAVAGLITAFGRVPGLNCAIGGWVVGGFILLCITFTINRDYERTQLAIKEARAKLYKSSSTIPI